MAHKAKKIACGHFGVNILPTPVSYTHLDVYKRQAPGQAARLLAQRLDAVCAGEDGGHAVGLTDGLYRRRALLLCFSVDFADTGLRTVRVETPIAPARDREGTKEYRQQAQYFFGPAQGLSLIHI